MANYLGLSIVINISLLFLTGCNIAFCFCTDLVLLILLRALTGALNNLNAFSKQYILEFFKSTQHSKVMSLYLSFQNLTTIIGLLIGSISFYAADIEITSISVNKYFISSALIAFINLVTLILNLVKFKLTIPTRRAMHYEVNMNNSNRINELGSIKKTRTISALNNPPNNVEIVNLDLFASNHNGDLPHNNQFHSKGEHVTPKEGDGVGQINKNALKKQFIKLDSEIMDTDNIENEKQSDANKQK
jgi:MFS family permease